MIQRSAAVRETMPIPKNPASVAGRNAKRNSYELNNIRRASFSECDRKNCTLRTPGNMALNGSPVSIGKMLAVWSVRRRGSLLTTTCTDRLSLHSSHSISPPLAMSTLSCPADCSQRRLKTDRRRSRSHASYRIFALVSATMAPTFSNDSMSATLNFTPNSISTATIKLM